MASWIGAGLPRAFAQTPTSTTPGVPRYFVNIFLRGGIDPVYTLDPKTQAEVAPKVDVPYGPGEIVEAGGVRFGPHFRALEKWAGQIAVVRGIQVKTANHESGAFQIVRMKTGVSTNMPSLLDIIGQQRDGQALASVSLGRTSSFEHSPGALAAPTGHPGNDHTSLNAVDDLSPDEIAMLAETYRLHLKRFPSWRTTAEAERTRENVAQTAAFFERLKTVNRFRTERWSKGARRQRLGEDLQRTLWLLENDLTRTVFVKVFEDWDSHFRNADKQKLATANFVSVFERFLTELHSRRNAHGTLAEQTVLVIGSEIGRFPIINGNLGKDHFPETALMFMGPTINTNDGKGASFSPTGKLMEGTTVSMDTGMPDKAGANLVLDDVGTTLLHMAGINPALYGYTGRRMRFLERA